MYQNFSPNAPQTGVARLSSASRSGRRSAGFQIQSRPYPENASTAAACRPFSLGGCLEVALLFQTCAPAPELQGQRSTHAPCTSHKTPLPHLCAPAAPAILLPTSLLLCTTATLCPHAAPHLPLCLSHLFLTWVMPLACGTRTQPSVCPSKVQRAANHDPQQEGGQWS